MGRFPKHAHAVDMPLYTGPVSYTHLAKSTTLVFASLFFGLTLFLVVTGLLHGLSPENYVSQWGGSDFALTYSIHEREDLISSEMVSEIGQLDGIENLRLTYAPYPQVRCV